MAEGDSDLYVGQLNEISTCKRHLQIWLLPCNFRETVEGGILVRLGSRQMMKLRWFSIQAPVFLP